LDNVEESQNFCLIIGLGQERYAKKPIVKILLQSLYFLLLINPSISIDRKELCFLFLFSFSKKFIQLFIVLFIFLFLLIKKIMSF